MASLSSMQQTKPVLFDGRTISREIGISDREKLLRLHKDTLERIKIRKVCITCGITFTESENFTNRGCRIHVGRSKNGIYSCCGEELGFRGCVSSMHIADEKILSTLKRDSYMTSYSIKRELVEVGFVRVNLGMVENYNKETPPEEYKIKIVAIYAPNYI